jgi:hypothetical protein
LHSLGIAIIRGTMVSHREAIVILLGRKRKRGRRPCLAVLTFQSQHSCSASTTALLVEAVVNDVQHDVALEK